jgi:hypothetical protein
MRPYPPVQMPINNSQQKQTIEKTNNNSNLSTEIKNKEPAASKSQE